MKIIANENVYEPIIEYFRDRGNQVISVRDCGLSGSSDESIFQKAVSEGLTIITMDKDFSKMKRFSPDLCEGIVLIKIYRHTVDETTRLFKKHFESLTEERIYKKLVIINPDRVRIRSYSKNE